MQATQKNRTLFIAGTLLFVFIIFLLASWYIAGKQSDFSTALKLNLAEQEKRMASFAELADRDSADSVVNKLLPDCEPEDRQHFDELLGRLAQLPKTELHEIDRLFDVCGSYFSDLRSITALRLERELDSYLEYVQLLSLVDENEAAQFSMKKEKWKTLVAQETERSKLSRRLVIIQSEIIDELVENHSIQSENIQALLEEAKNIKVSLISLNTSSDTLRQAVSPL